MANRSSSEIGSKWADKKPEHGLVGARVGQREASLDFVLSFLITKRRLRGRRRDEVLVGIEDLSAMEQRWLAKGLNGGKEESEGACCEGEKYLRKSWIRLSFLEWCESSGGFVSMDGVEELRI